MEVGAGVLRLLFGFLMKVTRIITDYIWGGNALRLQALLYSKVMKLDIYNAL